MSDILEIKGLRAGYGAQDVLYDVSLHINRGEVVSIIGPNGAGKSTLLKVIAGIIKAKEGDILYKGLPLHDKSPQQIAKFGISWVPQEDNIFPSMTVKENLEIGAFLLNGAINPRLDEVYSIFPQLKKHVSQIAGSLSGGQRQMLAVARGLLIRPELLLLDEPTSGLAPNLVHEMLQRIKEISESFGNTVLLVTQTIDALRLSRRGYLLAAGTIRYEDTTEEFLKNSQVRELYFGGITAINE